MLQKILNSISWALSPLPWAYHLKSWWLGAAPLAEDHNIVLIEVFRPANSRLKLRSRQPRVPECSPRQRGQSHVLAEFVAVVSVAVPRLRQPGILVTRFLVVPLDGPIAIALGSDTAGAALSH